MVSSRDGIVHERPAEQQALFTAMDASQPLAEDLTFAQLWHGGSPQKAAWLKPDSL